MSTAVVVGGASGICRATARVLAAAGHDVGIVDRDPADATLERVAAAGRRGAARQADVADAVVFGESLDSLAAELGPPDVLVYGAGITNHVAPVVRMTLDGWRRELEVNLTGAFVAVKHVLPHMVEQGYGRKHCLGASGMLAPSEGPWHHGFLFAPALTVGGGTSEIQRNIVAERILGLPRDAPATG